MECRGSVLVACLGARLFGFLFIFGFDLEDEEGFYCLIIVQYGFLFNQV